MKQEYKQLLLQDLCTRLPDGVIVSCAEGTVMGVHWNKVKLDASLLFELQDNDALCNVKPYLRTLSSMTEEEKKEFNHISSLQRDYLGDGNFYTHYQMVDWLNKKMFAYRTIDGKNMFELGLALEAPNGMYE